MKKDILVIGRDYHPDGKETAALIADALRPYAAKNDQGVLFCHLKELLFDIDNGSIKVIHVPTSKDIAEAGVVLMTNWFSHASIRKDMAHAVALYLDSRHVPFYNTEALHTRSTSKLSQMMQAALAGVRIPRTVFCLSLPALKEYLEQQQFVVPFILKDAQASRGNGNYLLNSLKAISAHASEHSERSPFMAQTLVDSDGSDYRFFVAGGKIRTIIHRLGSGKSHLHNTSAGATTEIVAADSVPQEAIGMVDKMSERLRREITGIDIMFDRTTREAYFLEANPIPQVVTGSNIEVKLQALAGALHEAAEGKPS